MLAKNYVICLNLLIQVDGKWSGWGPWQCSVTCGPGIATRYRSCTNPVPSNGGKDCVGSTMMTRVCTKGSCGKQISNLETLQVTGCYEYTCENGTCSNQSKLCDGGWNCQYPANHSKACKINGKWSSFGGYSTCSQPCGPGYKTRTRVCSNPSPLNGGKDCVGNDTMIVPCNNGNCTDKLCYDKFCNNGVCLDNERSCEGGWNCQYNKDDPQACKVHGGWARWTPYTPCSQTCDEGVKTHYRTCTNPSPANGGNPCIGKDTEIKPCNEANCTAKSCYNKFCKNGVCLDNESSCEGGWNCLYEKDDRRACKIDGGWSSWTPYASCSQPCGNGFKTRYRICSNPTPAHGGATCGGEDIQKIVC